jgi:predicted transposase YbfD/YdcC
MCASSPCRGSCLSPQALLQTARAHWQIENALHWQPDVSCGEDAARQRKDNGPANIAVLRRRALDVAASIKARDH